MKGKNLKRNKQNLEGHKIAIIIESKFISEEVYAYCFGFAALGATVEYLSRIYYGSYRPGHPDWKEPVFLSDVDPNDDEPWTSVQKLKFTLWEDKVSFDRPILRDFSAAALNDYSAILMAANYTSVRLRYEGLDFDKIPPNFNVKDFIRTFPASKFFSQAMTDKKVVKGALCHGLWILTPYPELLKGRKVICHTVVMADIALTEAEITLNKVVVDEDLVTGYSKNEVVPFIEEIKKRILSICR